MNLKHILISAITAVASCGAAFAGTVDGEGYPVMYVRGTMTWEWAADESYRFTRTGDVYTLSLSELDGEFKISDDDWTVNYGSQNAKIDGSFDISDAATVKAIYDTANFNAVGLTDVTLTFELKRNSDGSLASTWLRVAANGKPAPAIPDDPIIDPYPPVSGISGTLPVLYINVYTDETKSALNNEIIDRNLSHKNYFSFADYYLDLNGCEWLAAEGAASVGSKDEPLPLEIKARGNYTRTAFAKKPFKIKLGAKQNLLGLSKSKHFALLAHADDTYGYLRNFTGFNLGRRIGLPWTPWQQPVELVINGDYRGLYFLTESIRVEKDRVNITELEDLTDTPSLISGGYLVELDNYDEDNQTVMEEKSCIDGYTDMLRVTWDTPEDYSELQKRFIRDQFSAMNDGVGAADRSDELWAYMDLDDAARYYLVEELISHVEAYHGSTYLFRDRGEGQKWHFSPLWDCGNGFNGPTDGFFYDNDPYGNTWIPSMRENATFNKKVRETWAWFMNNGFKGIYDDMSAYAGHIAAAAKADRKRWENAPLPDINNRQEVVDNSDMNSRLNAAVWHLTSKAEWLKGQFGDYTQTPSATEPARDKTPAAPLPPYASEDAKNVTIRFIDKVSNPWQQVYAYVWGGHESTDIGNDELLGQWPGTAMNLPATAAADADGSNYPTWELSFFPEVTLNSLHKVIFNNGSKEQTDSYTLSDGSTYDRTGIVSGIEDILTDASSADTATYYNLQGIRIDNPCKGATYIRVSGNKAEKVRF